MSARIRDHIRSNVIGYVALFFALGGGAAWATHPGGANTISSGDIQENQVFSADVRNDFLTGGGLGAVDLQPNSVRSSEVAADSLGSGDLAPSSVGTSEVANSSIQLDDLAAAARGARAYAYGGGFDCPGDPVVFCPISRGKGVGYIVKVAQGKYCVGVNGISATAANSVALVSPVIGGVGSNEGVFARWLRTNSNCVSQEFEILVQAQPLTAVRRSDGSCCAQVSGLPVPAGAQPFVIVIP